MTENEKIELFNKWYDENYDEWAEGEEGIALREELEQAFKSGIVTLERENAELKKWQKDTIKARGNDYMDWSRMKDQLTKAKEIIHRLLVALKDHRWWNYHVIDEAEQFLKDN